LDSIIPKIDEITPETTGGVLDNVADKLYDAVSSLPEPSQNIGKNILDSLDKDLEL